MAAVCAQKKHVTQPVLTEWYALWRALVICDELMDFRKVVLEGDEQVVVNAINREEGDLSWYGQIINYESELEDAFTHRERNTVARVQRHTYIYTHTYIVAKPALCVEDERV